MIPSFFKIGLQRIGLLLIVYFFCRLLFLVWNWPQYSMFQVGDLLRAFVHGVRFDLSAILLTNSVLLLLWILPAQVWRWKWFQRLELALFGIINFICIGSNFVDAEFVQFIGKRSSYDILLIRQDLQQQGFSVISTYWYFLLALTLVVAVVLWLSPKFKNLREPQGLARQLGWRLLVIGLIVTGARGGYQFKPLHPMHAYFSKHHQLGLLVLNTPFNVIRSKPRGRIESQRFFASDKEAVDHLRQMTELSRPPLKLLPKANVVVIIVESLATEFVGAANPYDGYTPFLDELAKESFFFKFNLANARRSIEGLPAVICGIPAIMSEPVITSDFSNNRFDCLPRILDREGYSTHFLHGAHNGSMHFDTFSRIAGFENFVGLDEYPKDNPEDLDPYWGVLDEPMLQYAIRLLDQEKDPALISVFTLSSHHPYYIPPQHRGKFPKGPLEIHESIGYADYAIREFFRVAKTKPWFNNTIFVITGDHTQKFFHQEYNWLLGAYRVPLFIYAPGLKSSQVTYDPDRITQHIDIVPSILDLLGVTVEDRLLVGQSVFDTAKPGRAYCFASPLYWYVDDHLYLHMDRAGGVIDIQSNKNGINVSPDPVDQEKQESALKNLKSVVHYLNEGLIRNKLHDWRKE